MLDLKIMQREPDLVARALKRRHSSITIAEFTALDDKRRELLSKVEKLKGERNTVSGEVAKIKREGGDATHLIEHMGSVNAGIKELDAELDAVQAEQKDWMLAIPNILHESVPDGKDENDNVELHRWGTPREFSFKPKEHWELGEALRGLDFDKGAKLAGSRFVVSLGWAARMERALINFFLDIQTKEHGYIEVLPPLMVNRESMTGTGQLPKFEEDLFKMANWDFYLIPTAEVPLTNLHADDILDEKDFPLAYTAQTPCFRSEAGSYGKDTKGLIRMHQFTKVEMVRYSLPDKSYEALELMREQAESLLRRLNLPYRVITLCSGDTGFASTKTYDLEVWLPGQGKYREISSCSNCGDFQARRANIRFRPEGGGKPEFAHTLNGSGLPVGRTLVAILENYQQEDGSVTIPEALRPYMDNLETIRLGAVSK